MAQRTPSVQPAAAAADEPLCLPDADAIERRFAALADEWRRETAHRSFAIQKAAHPAYQEILRMGLPVVSILLRELEREPSHWFIALAEITGVNPIRPEHAGGLAEMAQDWVEFGRANGYL